ncbi:hypothetical protein B0H14DRAFT_3126138 [Mycena olivaceomarginata]|nr:hypothetical protein B0H14DRAFT_3126138 [Mycena olivaceomarginata]
MPGGNTSDTSLRTSLSEVLTALRHVEEVHNRRFVRVSQASNVRRTSDADADGPQPSAGSEDTQRYVFDAPIGPAGIEQYMVEISAICENGSRSSGSDLRMYTSNPVQNTRFPEHIWGYFLTKTSKIVHIAISGLGSDHTSRRLAPSELEIYSQAGLIPTTKGEKVAAHRMRTDENELRLCTHIVAIQRRIEQLEKKSGAQYAEVLLRVQDILKNGTPSATAITSPAISADVDRLNARMMEGRTAITNLTSAVNDLVDLPRDIARLSRTVQNLARNENVSSTTEAGTYNKCTPQLNAFWSRSNSLIAGDTSASTGSKRSSTFAGFNDPTENKRHRPTRASRFTLTRIHQQTSSASLALVTPRRSVIIRFLRAVAIADEFHRQTPLQPPRVMAKLHAAKKDAYEKKTKASDKGNLPWYT